jgi:predicted RNA binding protein YcfA (HicA-like mRNA interferase family)
VRDSAGVPQIGAKVFLLRPDLTRVASAYTDASGHYTIPAVFPGKYAVKAIGTSFLPSLRANVRVRSKTVVNLTLNTLYEVMQWLPIEPRSGSATQDDWAWTLRSAANRPLLRWLEDGPLVVTTDGSGLHPKLMARLVASGEQGAFGESGERISASIEQTPTDSRELLARVDFMPGTNAGIESMLGFRQDLGLAGSVQSVAAYALMPEVGEEGVSEAALRSWEQIRLGDEFEVEAGASQVLARLTGAAAQATTALLPFASMSWRSSSGNGRIAYRMASSLPSPAGSEDGEARAWLPAMAQRGSHLTLEHGRHQEIGWEQRTDASALELGIYTDRLENPVVEAMIRRTGSAALEDALVDSSSQLTHAAGADFSAAGFTASYERRLAGGSHMRLSYANGNALVVPAEGQHALSTGLAVRSLRPRHAQMYALALSGTLDRTGMRWRASYRWQPEDTVTQVAPFALNAAEPYLSLHLRQPIRLNLMGKTGIEALVDVSNLLAQGYRPYLLNDGSLLVFAQDQRFIRAGLAFTF